MKAQRHDEEEHKGNAALTLRTPDICVENFSADHNDTVEFQNIPAAGVTITQVSGYNYPFSPVTGTNANGLKYTDVTAGEELVIVAAAINQTYPYTVSCSCPSPKDDPSHSVTVDN